jgi:hypothetical protein
VYILVVYPFNLSNNNKQIPDKQERKRKKGRAGEGGERREWVLRVFFGMRIGVGVCSRSRSGSKIYKMNIQKGVKRRGEEVEGTREGRISETEGRAVSKALAVEL